MMQKYRQGGEAHFITLLGAILQGNNGISWHETDCSPAHKKQALF